MRNSKRSGFLSRNSRLQEMTPDQWSRSEKKDNKVDIRASLWNVDNGSIYSMGTQHCYTLERAVKNIRFRRKFNVLTILCHFFVQTYGLKIWIVPSPLYFELSDDHRRNIKLIIDWKLLCYYVEKEERTQTWPCCGIGQWTHIMYVCITDGLKRGYEENNRFDGWPHMFTREF